jgi:hypothetical protein
VGYKRGTEEASGLPVTRPQSRKWRPDLRDPALSAKLKWA